MRYLRATNFKQCHTEIVATDSRSLTEMSGIALNASCWNSLSTAGELGFSFFFASVANTMMHV
jgi:hypothetical protein